MIQFLIDWVSGVSVFVLYPKTDDTVWHEIFAGFNFCDFFHNPPKKNSHKKLFPAKKISPKIYSTTEIIKITI